MILFYAPHINQPHHTLSPEESLHCVKVLRLKKSDSVYVTDGKGTLCTGVLEEPDPRACRLLITHVAEHYGVRSYHLHIAVAPPKNTERFEWFVEKATEAGTDTITPIICDRSERKTLKTTRSERVAIAALKQCKRAQMPEIRQPVSFAEFLESGALDGTRAAIACCFTTTPRIPITRWIAKETSLTGSSSHPAPPANLPAATPATGSTTPKPSADDSLTSPTTNTAAAGYHTSNPVANIPQTSTAANATLSANAPSVTTPTRLTVLVGPEGDFTPREIDAAIACGCTPVDLGPSVLRTETAALGIVFLTAFHFLYL